ncbi:MAG: DsbA family protein [Parvularculaceae bacterium]
MKAKIAIAAAVAAGSAALGGAFVVGQTKDALAQSTQDDGRIEEIVRQYILDHPEVLVESLNAYMRDQEISRIQQTRDAARTLRPTLTSLDGGFAVGASPEDARVTIVELFDYHCGYCKRVAGELLETVRGRNDVRLIYKEFPILKEESEIAARAALAARNHGDYVAFHQAMMKSGGTLTDKRIDEIAKSAGVDVAAMRRGMSDSKIAQAIAETYELAVGLGVTGTPSFIVYAGDEAEIIVGANLPRVKQIIETGVIGDAAGQFAQQGPASTAGQ